MESDTYGCLMAQSMLHDKIVKVYVLQFPYLEHGDKYPMHLIGLFVRIE